MKDPTLLWALWISLGALATLLGAFIRAILTGQLTTKRELDDVRADRDKWQAAWHTSQETMSELSGRLDANTESLGFMRQLVEALAAKGPVR